MRKIAQLIAWSPAIAALLLPAVVLAQDNQGNPKSAGKAYPPLVEAAQDQNPNLTQNGPDSLQPDTHPLTGVQSATLGSAGIRHSYWLPGLEYGNIVRSSSLYQQSASDWNSTSYAVGNISLLREWSRAQSAMNYSGGGTFSTSGGGANSQFHQFGFVQTFEWNRLQLAIIDQFSYIPETQFGFGGATGLSIPGVGGSLEPVLPGLQNNYVPNQSIFTTSGPRYSNAAVTEATYSLTARSSLTLAGSFGILRFVQAGNVESNNATGSFGYDYALSRSDTLGLRYLYSAYRFPGNPQAINDHILHVAYGRKLTSRMALEIYGGPEYTTFRIPFAALTSRVSGSGGANLIYAFQRGNVSFTFNHGVTGGSGVFIGSGNDQLEAGLTRQVSRQWAGSMNFGYARNGSVVSTANAQSFNSWYAGANLNRPLGRYAAFSMGYRAQVQASSLPVCAAGTCATNFIVHQITLGFGWHTRPFVLQ